MSHPLGRLALLHPFPSALNALLVAALAGVAGAGPATAATLALAMFAFQASIGALNDLVDAPADAVAKPWKPIAAGRNTRRTASVIAVGSLAVGCLLSLAVGPAALGLGVLGWSCGAAYDVRLKRVGLGWLAFAIAFPVLLLFGWTGPTGDLPPGWPTLLPLAALAGPTLQLANALTDLEADREAGLAAPITRWSRQAAVRVLGVLLAVTFGLAWATLFGLDAGVVSVAGGVVASGLAVMGYLATRRGTPRALAWGWSLQAVGMAAFALAWVTAAAAG